MDRYAVISLPEVLQTGLALPLLFFDKIVVPDKEYVKSAICEIEHPESWSASYDTDGSRTIAEVRLGLGYHLWPDSHPVDWMSEPKRLLTDLQYLERNKLVTTVILHERDEISRSGSFGELDKINRLDDERIQVALQIASQDLVDVSTIRKHADKTALASVPRKIDKKDVIQFILRQVPIPPQDVPLDEILDFRKDARVQADLSRLRSWMSKAVKQHETLLDVEDEYRTLYEDYKQSVTHLSKKYNTSTLGIIATVTAEFVDNIGQVKFGSAIKALVDWRSSSIELEDKLQDVKGREFAYLKEIEDIFAK